jgi:hypothetical protein
MCLRFQFCTHQRVCILHFRKKVKFAVPTVRIAYILSGPFSPCDGGKGVPRGAAGQLSSGCANREGFVVQLLYPRPENTEGRLQCKKGKRFSCPRLGSLWLVTSRLGMGKLLTFFYNVKRLLVPRRQH